MNVLVTGGAGFIGHHLVRALWSRGDVVTVIDNFATGLRHRMDEFPTRVRIVEGDIRDSAALADAARGCNIIFHQAAVTSVALSFREPQLTSEVNVGGTIQIMLAAAQAGVRRVVLASSAAVYGLEPQVPTRESEALDPRSPYAASKAASEHFLKSLGPDLGVETVALRYFNVFGPGQDARSEYAAVIPRFITAALRGERMTIYGDGLQSRDFTYVDNVVQANLLAGSIRDIDGLTVNIGSGTSYSLQDLIAVVTDRAAHPSQVIHMPAREGDPRRSQASIRLARARLGYVVTVSFQDGIRRAFEWCKEHLDQLSGNDLNLPSQIVD